MQPGDGSNISQVEDGDNTSGGAMIHLPFVIWVIGWFILIPNTEVQNNAYATAIVRLIMIAVWVVVAWLLW